MRNENYLMFKERIALKRAYIQAHIVRGGVYESVTVRALDRVRNVDVGSIRSYLLLSRNRAPYGLDMNIVC